MSSRINFRPRKKCNKNEGKTSKNSFYPFLIQIHFINIQPYNKAPKSENIKLQKIKIDWSTDLDYTG
jgi:hypothetical protein